MATFNKLVTDYKTIAVALKTAQSDVRIQTVNKSSKLVELKNKIIEINGTNSHPFYQTLADGSNIIIRDGLVFRIEYDLAENTITQLEIDKLSGAITVHNFDT